MYMKRLTKHWGDNYIATGLDYDFLWEMPTEDFKHFEAIVKRLAEYEDLGFTPEEIAYMAKFFKEHTSAETIEDNMRTAANLMEWAKYKDLEEQGRLIILSVDDIHPCKYCDSGWGSISSEGCKSCYDDCERLKQYNEKYRN